ncbi:hypothetical protein NUW54_g1339 [Trametes sanguinea]|uniref:Uncharacterized protein n=1 Tax=Trametes sanguinea TaxID=158606 RepID=A0ACC1Q9C2_9APHY|nr:hypothetical protein NUW54_g1339 [Trametes sanguinea]
MHPVPYAVTSDGFRIRTIILPSQQPNGRPATDPRHEASVQTKRDLEDQALPVREEIHMRVRSPCAGLEARFRRERLVTGTPSPRLPMDLCEDIIDLCAAPTVYPIVEDYLLWHYLPEAAKTLKACALTCHDWLPRSIYSYYAGCITFQDTKDVDRLIAVIARHPCVASFVRILWVQSMGLVARSRLHAYMDDVGESVYVAFARTDLVQNLKNLHTIVYHGASQWPYPTFYNLHFARYPSLTTLRLSSAFRTPLDLCRLVWALDKLQALHLHNVRFDPRLYDEQDPAYARLESLAARKPRCTSLRALFLEAPVTLCKFGRDPFSSAPLHQWDPSDTPMFPYECAFGTSVVRLAVTYPSPHVRPSGPIAPRSREYEYISRLASLEELTVLVRRVGSDRSDEWSQAHAFVSWLRDVIIPRVQARKSLQWMRLHILDPHSTKRLFIYQTFQRGNYLDDVFNRAPGLRRLTVQVDSHVQDAYGNGLGKWDNVYERIESAMPCLNAELFIIKNELNGNVFGSL